MDGSCSSVFTKPQIFDDIFSQNHHFSQIINNKTTSNSFLSPIFVELTKSNYADTF